jgi:hypothetical protein
LTATDRDGLIRASRAWSESGALYARRYNPGLATSIVLFLPVGGWALWAVQASGAATSVDHLIGFGVGVAIHAIIIAYAKIRRSQLLPLGAT